MTEAIFGLVGVLIGGLITAGIEERRRRIERKAQRHLAARIIIDESTWLAASVMLAIDGEDASRLRDGAPLVDAWRTYRQDLGELPWDHWLAIEQAVERAAWFHPSMVWSDQLAGGLRDLQSALTNAASGLVDHAR